MVDVVERSMEECCCAGGVVVAPVSKVIITGKSLDLQIYQIYNVDLCGCGSMDSNYCDVVTESYLLHGYAS